VGHDITGQCMQLLHGLCCFDFVSDIPLLQLLWSQLPASLASAVDHRKLIRHQLKKVFTTHRHLINRPLVVSTTTFLASTVDYTIEINRTIQRHQLKKVFTNHRHLINRPLIASTTTFLGFNC